MRYTLTSASRFNIGHDARAPVRDANGERVLRWGLLRPWSGHGGKRGPNVYEATLAQIESLPFLRTARTKARCLVLADGWFAWKKLASKKKQPYWIHAPAPTAFAGLIATHGDDSIPSFAIVTVPATGIAADVADVMPAVVDAGWLASPDLAAHALTGWRVDAVSNRVHDETADDASVVAPLGNPNQGELF